MAIPIPRFLHEVLGEAQSPGELAAILGAGVGLPVLVAAAFPELTAGLPGWRSALAYLLIADIGAGCVANFTQGTSNYYAARPRERLIFIAVHVHPLILAGLLGTGFGGAFLAWAYTTLGALGVNALHGRRRQPFAAGALLTAGVVVITMGAGLPTPLLAVALLFMIKVLVAFAVDHYRPAAAD